MNKLVIFDCDGVLVDTETIIGRARLNILLPLGFPAVEADMTPLRGMTSTDAYDYLANRFGRPLPEDILQRFWKEFDALIHTGLSSIPGVVRLIDTLTVPYCVASNGSHRFMETTLGAAGLAQKFANRIFSANEVARPKPYPDLFQHAAKQMTTEAAECIVIEDSIRGVTAAVAAGMQVIGFSGSAPHNPDHGQELRAAGAHAVCPTMEDAQSVLIGYGCAV